MEKLVEIAKITSKYQITIPKDIRLKLNLKAGDKVLFFEENSRIFIGNSNYAAPPETQAVEKPIEGVAKEVGPKEPSNAAKSRKQARKAKGK